MLDNLKSILDDVSIDAPWELTEKFAAFARWKPEDVNASCDMIVERLARHGVPVRVLEPELYLSIPYEASVELDGEVLRAKPPAPHGREVMRLTTAIDTMRRELEGRPFVEAFAADLSHELKNPVAAIRASAEVLADGALEEPEEAERFLARIREATSRIEALLGELLSLARLEARGATAAGTGPWHPRP